MLLPALQKAREKGRSSSCTSNLKQFGTAFQMYTHDNNDLWPRHYTTSPVLYIWDQNGPIAKYLGMDTSPNRIGFCGHGSKNKFACPSAPFKSDTGTYGVTTRTVTGTVAHGAGANGFWKTSGFQKPARTASIMDLKQDTNGFQGNQMHVNNDPNRQFDYRHSDGINVNFLDGHVKYLKSRAIPIYFEGHPYHNSKAYYSYFWWPAAINNSFVDIGTY